MITATALPIEKADRRVEELRRKTPTETDVGKEALKVYKELIAEGRSPSEAFTIYGYGLRVVKQAIRDEQRILSELATKPAKDVEAGCLDVAAVMVENDVVEFKVVEPVEIVKPK